MTASFNLLKGFSSSVRKPSISLKIMFPDPDPPGQRGEMMKIFVTRKRFHIAAFLTADSWEANCSPGGGSWQLGGEHRFHWAKFKVD